MCSARGVLVPCSLAFLVGCVGSGVPPTQTVPTGDTASQRGPTVELAPTQSIYIDPEHWGIPNGAPRVCRNRWSYAVKEGSFYNPETSYTVSWVGANGGRFGQCVGALDVGNVTGGGDQVVCIELDRSRLHLIEDGAWSVAPEGPPPGLTLPFAHRFLLDCGDVTGDGIDDLCTSNGIDHGPVDGVYDRPLFGSVPSDLLVVDLDHDGTNEVIERFGTHTFKRGEDEWALPEHPGTYEALGAAPSAAGGDDELWFVHTATRLLYHGRWGGPLEETTTRIPMEVSLERVLFEDFTGDGIPEVATWDAEGIDVYDLGGQHLVEWFSTFGPITSASAGRIGQDPMGDLLLGFDSYNVSFENPWEHVP